MLTLMAGPPIGLLNHVVNPVVRTILRSPMHGVLSKKVVLLTVRGRVSGREFTFPAQYTADGDDLVVVPGFPDKKRWWRNLVEPAPVGVRLRGDVRTGTAHAITDPEEPHTVVVRIALDPVRGPSPS